MNTTPTVIGVAVSALVAGVVVLIGVPGGASGLVSKKNTITLRGGERDAMRFRCKGARRAWVAGFAGDFRPGDGGPRILPKAAYKPRIQRHRGTGRGREWVIGAENHGTRRGTFTGYAYCRKAKPLRARKTGGSIPSGEEFTQRVRCRPDQGRVVSGGFDTAMLVFGSRKTGPRRWSVSALAPPGFSGRFYFDAMAYSRPGPNTKPRRGAIKVASGQTVKVFVCCHRNERLLSGGFANPDFDSGGGAQMFPHVSRRAGKKHRWTVVAHNLGGAPGTLVAFAYCRPR
jgi:hypothetical protein